MSGGIASSSMWKAVTQAGAFIDDLAAPPQIRMLCRAVPAGRETDRIENNGTGRAQRNLRVWVEGTTICNSVRGNESTSRN